MYLVGVILVMGFFIPWLDGTVTQVGTFPLPPTSMGH
jgi:hypothetical protein